MSAAMHPNFEDTSHIPDIPARGYYRATDPHEHPVIAKIEPVAEWIAERIFMVMGPLFWLVIILGFLAITLGIIPNE